MIKADSVGKQPVAQISVSFFTKDYQKMNPPNCLLLTNVQNLRDNINTAQRSLFYTTLDHFTK